MWLCFLMTATSMSVKADRVLIRHRVVMSLYCDDSTSSVATALTSSCNVNSHFFHFTPEILWLQFHLSQLSSFRTVIHTESAPWLFFWQHLFTFWYRIRFTPFRRDYSMKAFSRKCSAETSEQLWNCERPTGPQPIAKSCACALTFLVHKCLCTWTKAWCRSAARQQCAPHSSDDWTQQ